MRPRIRVVACAVAMWGAMWGAMSMALPGAAWAQSAFTTAHVGFDGRVNWTEEDLKLAEVEARMKALAQSDSRIQVTARKEAEFRDVEPVISAALRAGLEVILPSEFVLAPAMVVDEAKPSAAALRIFVDFDGALYWQGKAVDRAGLEKNLAAASERDSKAEVWLEPHRLARFTAVDEVFVILNLEGLRNVRMVRP